MPPKIKTSRETIIEAGYRIADREGIENLNCRAIAAEIGCSTQPVFSRFPNMDELKEAIFQYACVQLEESIQNNDATGNSLMDVSVLNLVELARNHKNIYKLIYLSDFRSETSFLEEREKYETNQKILDELTKKYKIAYNRAEEIFERLSLLVHGICTVVATTSMDYSNEQVMHIVNESLHDAITRINL